MKKILAVLALCLFTLGTIGCSGDKTDSKKTDSKTKTDDKTKSS